MWLALEPRPYPLAVLPPHPAGGHATLYQACAGPLPALGRGGRGDLPGLGPGQPRPLRPPAAAQLQRAGAESGEGTLPGGLLGTARSRGQGGTLQPQPLTHARSHTCGPGAIALSSQAPRRRPSFERPQGAGRGHRGRGSPSGAGLSPRARQPGGGARRTHGRRDAGTAAAGAREASSPPGGVGVRVRFRVRAWSPPHPQPRGATSLVCTGRCLQLHQLCPNFPDLECLSLHVSASSRSLTRSLLFAPSPRPLSAPLSLPLSRITGRPLPLTPCRSPSLPPSPRPVPYRLPPRPGRSQAPGGGKAFGRPAGLGLGL